MERLQELREAMGLSNVWLGSWAWHQTGIHRLDQRWLHRLRRKSQATAAALPELSDESFDLTFNPLPATQLHSITK
jgi:hypothetical protein